jgi:hypothetical protein
LFHKPYAEVILKVGCTCSTSGDKCQYRLDMLRIGGNGGREERKIGRETEGKKGRKNERRKQVNREKRRSGINEERKPTFHLLKSINGELFLCSQRVLFAVLWSAY